MKGKVTQTGGKLGVEEAQHCFHTNGKQSDWFCDLTVQLILVMSWKPSSQEASTISNSLLDNKGTTRH